MLIHRHIFCRMMLSRWIFSSPWATGSRLGKLSWGVPGHLPADEEEELGQGVQGHGQRDPGHLLRGGLHGGWPEARRLATGHRWRRVGAAHWVSRIWTNSRVEDSQKKIAESVFGEGYKVEGLGPREILGSLDCPLWSRVEPVQSEFLLFGPPRGISGYIPTVDNIWWLVMTVYYGLLCLLYHIISPMVICIPYEYVRSVLWFLWGYATL